MFLGGPGPVQGDILPVMNILRKGANFLGGNVFGGYH